MDFLALKRNLRKDYSHFKPFKLGLLSDAAPQFLAQALRGMSYEFQIDLQIYQATIGTIAQEINGYSGLYTAQCDGVLLYHSLQAIQTRFYKTELNKRSNFSSIFLEEFKIFIQKLGENKIRTVFVNLFSVEDDAVFGQFGLQTELSFRYQIQKINLGLSELACQNPAISLIQLPTNYFDPKFYYSSQADISFEALPKVAKSFLQNLAARQGKVKKCVVIDLDNTIWGGIVGDDGWENLELGLLGRGKVFTDIQLWLKELKNRGILLAVCSKNEVQTAKEVFEKYPEMVLQLADIALFVANWQAKSENIKTIAQTLNIGLDSLVFLDDNAAERAQVKTVFPEMTVPDLPSDPSEWLLFLQNENLFETAAITAEDFDRTEKYRQETERKQESISFSNQDDFLKSLEMKAKALPIDAYTLPRVAQLLQRTNQFNLRSIRHSEAEIKAMIESERFIGFAISLQDKFGDEGIVSAVLLEQKEDALFVETWVMSCRVFERGLEKWALNLMLDEGLKSRKNIRAVYIPTTKNQYIKNLLPTLGFEEKDDFFELESSEKYFIEHFISSAH